MRREQLSLQRQRQTHQHQRKQQQCRLEPLRNVVFALVQAKTELFSPVAARDARSAAPCGLCSSFHSLAKAPSPSCNSTTPTTAAAITLPAAAVIALPAPAEAIALPAAIVIALPAPAGAIALAAMATASEAGLLNFTLPLRNGILNASVKGPGL
ncbi:hypothetical protein Emed_006973 [Eimeria media]